MSPILRSALRTFGLLGHPQKLSNLCGIPIDTCRSLSIDRKQPSYKTMLKLVAGLRRLAVLRESAGEPSVSLELLKVEAIWPAEYIVRQDTTENIGHSDPRRKKGRK